VALYVPALRVGGAQHVTVNIANGFAGRGHPVDLVVSHARGGFRDQVSEAVNLVDLGTPELPGIGIGASVPALQRYLDRAEPGILFSAMTFANVIALAAARLSTAETRIVPTEHDEFGMDRRPKSRLVSRLAGRLYPSADHVLGVSAGVVESVVRNTGIDREQVSIMYNPIEVAEIRDRAAEPPTHEWAVDPSVDLVFTVGRLEPQKDLPTLIEAFESVATRRPDARLVVAGKGSRAGVLQERVRERGLGDVVDLPGYVDNPYAFMANAATFALSSRHEGLPTVLIEALACGCPVVSTDCPSGPAEILQDGEYGRLVPVDDPEALADGIAATIDDPPPADRLRGRADDFARETVIEEYVRFVDRRLGEHVAGATP
jgi:glycosyltransferase involved in cell wall biosynthesis